MSVSKAWLLPVADWGGAAPVGVWGTGLGPGNVPGVPGVPGAVGRLELVDCGGGGIFKGVIEGVEVDVVASHSASDQDSR